MGNKIQNEINKSINDHIKHVRKYTNGMMSHSYDPNIAKKEMDNISKCTNYKPIPGYDEYVTPMENKENNDQVVEEINKMLNIINKSDDYSTLGELVELLKHFPQDSKYEITNKGIVIYTNTKLGIVTLTGGD